MSYRKFDTGTWHDKRFEKLNPKERYLFIYLWTNDLCNQAGLYEITFRRIEFDTKLPSREVEPLLKGISTLVQVWPDREVVWVKNFLKRQCQNKQFAEGALSFVVERYPDLLQMWVNTNKSLLKKYEIPIPEIPSTGVQPPFNPPSTPAVTEAVTDTETDTEKPLCPNSVAFGLAELLAGLIKENNSKAKIPAKLDKWCLEIDRMLRLDKHSSEEIQAVIVWCQNDEFWRDVILSAGKLREKFAQLWGKMNNGNRSKENTKDRARAEKYARRQHARQQEENQQGTGAGQNFVSDRGLLPG